MKKNTDKNDRNLLFKTQTQKKTRPSFWVGIITTVILIALACVSLIINNKSNDNKVPESDLSIHVTSSAAVEAEDATQYNIWFNVNSKLEDTVITFNPSYGMVVKFDNATEEITLAESVHTNDLSKYSFIWIADYVDFKMFANMKATASNETISKDVSLYVIFNENNIAFTDKIGYIENGGMLDE
jgi:hypothetical protein